jgi:hypothetical protein
MRIGNKGQVPGIGRRRWWDLSVGREGRWKERNKGSADTKKDDRICSYLYILHVYRYSVVIYTHYIYIDIVYWHRDTYLKSFWCLLFVRSSEEKKGRGP